VAIGPELIAFLGYEELLMPRRRPTHLFRRGARDKCRGCYRQDRQQSVWLVFDAILPVESGRRDPDPRLERSATGGGASEERKKVGVDHVGVCCGHAVRQPRIYLQRRVFQYFGGHET
jgi:hypothetical protein